MSKLYKIEVKIRLHKVGGRTMPIKSGYRPGFNFIENKQTSGSIHLVNTDEIEPGSEGLADLYFISNELIGEITSGNEVKFYEGPIEIGVAEILKDIGWVERP